MTSMVERMAWAMAGVDERTGVWDDLPGFAKDIYLDCALAALREMREPSNEMIGAMRRHAVPKTQGLGAAFRAAIDTEIAAYEAGR